MTRHENIIQLISGVSPKERRMNAAEQVSAAPFYVIVTKTRIEEADFDTLHYDRIVRDIADGQYEDIDRIFHCTPGGLCEDVTHDTACDVEKLLIGEEGSEYTERSIAPWLEKHLGGLQHFEQERV